MPRFVDVAMPAFSVRCRCAVAERFESMKRRQPYGQRVDGDSTQARVVLTVGADNLPAASRYWRHNFAVTNALGEKVSIERRPGVRSAPRRIESTGSTLEAVIRRDLPSPISDAEAEGVGPWRRTTAAPPQPSARSEGYEVSARGPSDYCAHDVVGGHSPAVHNTTASFGGLFDTQVDRRCSHSFAGGQRVSYALAIGRSRSDAARLAVRSGRSPRELTYPAVVAVFAWPTWRAISASSAPLV